MVNLEQLNWDESFNKEGRRTESSREIYDVGDEERNLEKSEIIHCQYCEDADSNCRYCRGKYYNKPV